MSLKSGVVLLLGQSGVNSVQVSKSRGSKSAPDFNLPAPCFTVALKRCSSPYIHCHPEASAGFFIPQR